MQILEWPHEALSTKCEVVTEFGPELWQQLDDMWKAMKAVKEIDAMALAANQVGIIKRFFVMKDLEGNRHELVNPVWEPDLEGGWANQDEGCLSTPNLWGTVPSRHQTVSVKAKNRDGEPIEMVAEGLEAICIQHETDHLDGVFWLDKMPRNSRRALTKQWKKRKGIS